MLIRRKLPGRGVPEQQVDCLGEFGIEISKSSIAVPATTEDPTEVNRVVLSELGQGGSSDETEKYWQW